ncbi:MAG: hypothetical protein BA870_10845 [Desulfuromonadales bacterium C00003094]|nr:MAG: hypothetical protein BA870_10845 [Desulfuromonadales bacterium C00003094]
MMKRTEWTPIFKAGYPHVGGALTDPFAYFRNAVVNRNESWDIFIAQDRGAGKSATAMGMAMMIDPHFTIDHWCFTTERFIELITTPQRKGTVVVFDDMGTQGGGSSRKWNADGAHDLADIMQLNRTDGIITIGTSLELARSELRFRRGFKVLVSPEKKLSNEDTRGRGLATLVDLRIKSTDVFNDEVRYKLMRYAPGGRIKRVVVPHPPVDMWLKYQGIRDTFLAAVKGGNDEVSEPDKNAGLSNDELRAHLGVTMASTQLYKSLIKSIVKDGFVEGGNDILHKDMLADRIVQMFVPDGDPEQMTKRIRSKLLKSGVLKWIGTGKVDLIVTTNFITAMRW